MDPNAIEPLEEVCSIATGNAANALSKLIGQTVTFAVPSVKTMSVEEVSKTLGSSAELLSASMVKITGDANGLILFSLDPSGAQALSADIINRQTGGEYKDIDQSVLKEMVNIVGGAALSSLSQFLDIKLLQSVPDSTTDMIGAVIDPFMAEIGASYNKVLVLQEVCTIPAKGVSLKFLMLIDPPSTAVMLQKVAEKLSTPHAAND
jgi:chemotaxis protein CheC